MITNLIILKYYFKYKDAISSNFTRPNLILGILEYRLGLTRLNHVQSKVLIGMNEVWMVGVGFGLEKYVKTT